MSTRPAIRGACSRAAIVCALTLPWMASAALARADGLTVAPGQPAEGSSTAALVGCAATGPQSERSATFSGEMIALPGTVRMTLRIELLERASGETAFHPVVAPGLGVWRPADPNVKVYKYLKQVSNLAAPASYRAAIVFRWQGSHGHTIRRTERLTRVCHQVEPTPVTEAPPTSPPSTTGTATTPATPAG
ncbi:MAG TPA: hypothetical protein VL972_07400 [Solirubrobacteraceae bacterium]|nr:hypothetical protein [Solirubrobacteraceae bacterium]